MCIAQYHALLDAWAPGATRRLTLFDELLSCRVSCEYSAMVTIELQQVCTMAAIANMSFVISMSYTSCRGASRDVE
jgi:hypothetical protein